MSACLSSHNRVMPCDELQNSCRTGSAACLALLFNLTVEGGELFCDMTKLLCCPCRCSWLRRWYSRLRRCCSVNRKGCEPGESEPLFSAPISLFGGATDGMLGLQLSHYTVTQERKSCRHLGLRGIQTVHPLRQQTSRNGCADATLLNRRRLSSTTSTSSHETSLCAKTIQQASWG